MNGKGRAIRSRQIWNPSGTLQAAPKSSAGIAGNLQGALDTALSRGIDRLGESGCITRESIPRGWISGSAASGLSVGQFGMLVEIAAAPQVKCQQRL